MSSWIRWPVDINSIMYLFANHSTSLNVSSQDKNSSIYCILLSWEVNEIIYVKGSGLCLEHKNLIHVSVTVITAAAAAIVIIIIIIASPLHMNLQVANFQSRRSVHVPGVHCPVSASSTSGCDFVYVTVLYRVL